MARAGMHNYTLILNQIARADIRDFFSKRISECVDFYNFYKHYWKGNPNSIWSGSKDKKCSDILIDNGWLEQPPQAIKHENLANI